MTEIIIIEAMENNRNCSTVVSDIACSIDSINHLEEILIEKIKYRKDELNRITRDYNNAIQSYSTIILKLLTNIQ